MFRPVQVELEEYHEILAQLIQTRELGDLLIKMLYMCRSLKKKKLRKNLTEKILPVNFVSWVGKKKIPTTLLSCSV